MRSGSPFTAHDAVPAHAVTAGATPIEAQRVAVTRSIGGAGLPSELGGGGDPVPAFADVEVVPDSDRGVVVYQGSPWRRQGGRPLPLGTALSIDTGEDETLYRQFTGVVTADDGDHTAAMSLHAEDDLSWMGRTVSWGPLWDVMPPAQDAPEAYRTAYRRIRLSHWFVLDRALRAVRRGTHPGWGGGNGVSAPLVDSSWPEIGTCWQSYHNTSGSGFLPSFARDQSLRTRTATDLWAVYGLSGPVHTGVSGGVTFALRVGPGHAAFATFTLRFPSGSGLVVQVTSAREVRVYDAADSATRVSYQLTAEETSVRVRVSTDGLVSIGTNVKTAASGTLTIPTEWTNTAASRLDVGIAGGSSIGGLQVSTDTLSNYLGWSQPTNFYPSPNLPADLSWVPRIHSEDVGALLSDGCRSACLAWGIDADGVLDVWSPDTARDPATREFTTTLPGDVLGALAWSRDVDSARHQVVIRHTVGEVDRNLWPTTVLWEGSGRVLPPGAQSVDIASTPADEEWLAHTEMYQVGGNGDPAHWATDPTLGRGSLWGGYIVKTADRLTTINWAGDELGMTLSWSETAGKYVFTTTAFADRLLSDEEAVLATVPVDHPSTSLPTRYRDQSLPLLRGWVRMVKTDAETRSTRTGPETAPDLVHDAGWWVQAGAQALADWLALKACPLTDEVGLVTLDRVPVRTDHRLEAGDVLTIHDEEVTRLKLVVLVRAVSIVSGPGQSSISLDVEILSGHSTILTVGEVDATFAGQTVGDVDTAKVSQTLGDDSLNPTVQSR